MFFRELRYDGAETFGTELGALVRTTKLVHVTGVPAGIDQTAFYEGISETVGRFVDSDEDAVSGEKTGSRWTDIRYDAEHDVHFRHSKTGQPLHTDSAYEESSLDLVFFYCVKQAAHGGESLFLDSFDLIYHLNRQEPSLLDDLQHVPVTFRKGRGGKTKPVITWDGHGPILTWNYYRASAPDARGQAMIEALHAFLQRHIVDARHARVLKIMPGEAVFFQDERLLHGRTAFSAVASGDRLFWKGGLVYA
jgi:alpha-ketoglutarate-dependent taurine dioxygenase